MTGAAGRGETGKTRRMARRETAFTIGIEEEYLLVDRKTRDVVPDPPPEMLADCERQLEGQVGAEFLRCQIEVETRVCATIAQARADLVHLRSTVGAVAARHGLAAVAVSTHPFADWHPQKHTDKERYNRLAEDMATPMKRMLICGMHVHIGIDGDDRRIDAMNRARRYLPHLLCLSTSSPFWQGLDTGMKSYRLAAFSELPRTGIPDYYGSYEAFQRQLGTLTGPGVIEDGTKLWWDIRPSARFPTVEMRVTDVCSRLDDCVTIAALFLSLMRLIDRQGHGAAEDLAAETLLIKENRWRAQRYGFDEGLIDPDEGRIVPFPRLLDGLLDAVREDAEALGCSAEIDHARDILRRGTSAHRQIEIHRSALADGADEREALTRVVDWLIEETGRGIPCINPDASSGLSHTPSPNSG